jgi:hypothetical protein
LVTGKFDDLPGDDSVRKIVRKPEGCSRHFKRHIENLVGFSIKITALILLTSNAMFAQRLGGIACAS